MEYTYDLTLSFAGEDREYVSAVAKILQGDGIKVFYDEFEEADIWGKDLGIHFDYVYRKQAKYFIPFISKHYKDKVWTNYEFKSAISRAIETNSEYILPARFDDTQLEGLRPSIAFIDLRKYSPTQFAQIIKRKLGQPVSVPIAEQEQKKLTASVYLGVNAAFNQSSFGMQPEGVVFNVRITNLEKEHKYFNEPYFKSSTPIIEGQDTFHLINPMSRINFPVKLEYGEVLNINYPINHNSHHMYMAMPDSATIVANVTSTIGEKFISNEANLSSIKGTIEYFDGN